MNTPTRTVTPEELFLLYASPCMDGRHMQGKITDANFDVLAAILADESQPPQTLLAECFPDAVQSLTEHAQAMGLPVWSDEVVASYWRHHHHGESPVTHGTVVFPMLGKHRNKVEVALRTGESVVVLNALNLALKAGDEVTIHNHVIIENLTK